jgi:hypothetical protein
LVSYETPHPPQLEATIPLHESHPALATGVVWQLVHCAASWLLKPTPSKLQAKNKNLFFIKLSTNWNRGNNKKNVISKLIGSRLDAQLIPSMQQKLF